MKYKVGDKVQIKSLEWYKNNRDLYGHIVFPREDEEDVEFDSLHADYCGQIMTIRSIVYGSRYIMEDDIHESEWTDEMIEGFVEEEMSLDKAGQMTDFEYEGLAYTLPDGYQFVDENGNVINVNKIVLEKKKKEYPKTYCECKDILGLWDIDDTECGYYKTDLIDKLQMLLICRDAYWKIAGEEMCLDKPWEPDWKKQDKKYIISVFEDTVIYFENETYNRNTVLTFPTEEMRDAFYENFKELINECKELL